MLIEYIRNVVAVANFVGHHNNDVHIHFILFAHSTINHFMVFRMRYFSLILTLITLFARKITIIFTVQSK